MTSIPLVAGGWWEEIHTHYAALTAEERASTQRDPTNDLIWDAFFR
jgi:hypothetical protein